MPSFTEEGYVPLSEVTVSRRDVLNCSYSAWYYTFQEHTLSKTKIIRPLPAGFIKYLHEDDIRLPRVQPQESSLFYEVKPTSDNEYSDWSDNEDDVNYQDPTENFREVHETIQATIKEFGGCVAPKLNWSSPQDAVWMLIDNTMMCRSANDVYLLLKSSDYIVHDLEHAFDVVNTDESGDQNERSFEFELVLRKWVDLNPAMEFRCFVRDRQLLAISQRDLNYYDFLDSLKEKLVERIGTFFDDVLLPKFESNNFAFDVYLNRDLSKVYIVDFNPFSRTTNSYLYSWNELITGKYDPEDPEIRLVTEHNTGRFACKEHSQNHVPRDVLDASMDSAAMVELAKEWERALRQQPDSSDESDKD